MNRQRQVRRFRVGDKVQLQRGLKSTRDKGKLESYFVGRYTIGKVLPKGAYCLVLPDGTRHSATVNTERLYPWHESDHSKFPHREYN